MSLSRKAFCQALVGGWALLLLGGNAAGQAGSDPAVSDVSSLRNQWEQKVLQGGQAQPVSQASTSRRTAQPWSPVRRQIARAPITSVSGPIGAGAVTPAAAIAEGEIEMEGLQLAPTEAADPYYDGAMESSCDGGCSVGGPPCGACGEVWCGPGPGYLPCRPLLGYVVGHLSIFAGVQGFKGPPDLGRNGNFGFHEGVNFGAPLGGPWGTGYQIGFQAVQSNLSGDQTTGIVRNTDRDQIFLTAGLFRRAMCRGLQWGVAFDSLHDRYHGTADLEQIRAELSFVFDGTREIGFWGAFGLGGDEYLYEQQQRLTMEVDPLDIYAFFYRRHFCEGGQGRLWAGVSGQGEAVLGADVGLPLGTSWALEGNFTYLVPKEGTGLGAQEKESWGMALQLVWYPGRDARCARQDPFHPLMSVADNSVFLIDRH
jgi:hypothetical protein